MEKNNRKVFVSGAFFGLFVMLMVIVIAFMACWTLGFVQIGTNGEIYVQGYKDDDTDTGIGTKVEDKLNKIDSYLDNYFYFDNVEDSTVAENIYKAYVAAYGDKYTTYYTAEEYAKQMSASQGIFYGIGAEVSKSDEGYVLIKKVKENSPAQKAGIVDGDKIVTIDGTAVADLTLTQAVELMRGEKDTTVTFEIMHEGADELKTVTAIRAPFEEETVTQQMLDGNIGYILIDEFDEVTVNQFKTAYDDLETQGMVGLIVDLRYNPGGRLDAVVSMLDYILPKGLIVYTEDKYGQRKEYSGSDNHEISVPMAVLVNGDSASAAEIFTGAVQDYGVGTIVGTQTFGKGIVQTIQPLSDGSAIKLTISKYFTAKGQDIHGKGITPDIEVDVSDAVKEIGYMTIETDDQLQAAIKNINDKIQK